MTGIEIGDITRSRGESMSYPDSVMWIRDMETLRAVWNQQRLVTRARCVTIYDQYRNGCSEVAGYGV